MGSGDSTWSVMEPTGIVRHMPGEPTHTAIRKALGGYVPEAVPLKPHVESRLRVWASGAARHEGPVANFPARALLQGLLNGPAPLVGPVVFSGVDGEGIPSDVFARLEAAHQRAQHLPQPALVVASPTDKPTGKPEQLVQGWWDQAYDSGDHTFDAALCAGCRAWQRETDSAEQVAVTIRHQGPDLYIADVAVREVTTAVAFDLMGALKPWGVTHDPMSERWRLMAKRYTPEGTPKLAYYTEPWSDPLMAAVDVQRDMLLERLRLEMQERVKEQMALRNGGLTSLSSAMKSLGVTDI